MAFDRPQVPPDEKAPVGAAPVPFVVTIDGVGHVPAFSDERVLVSLERAQSLGRLPELRIKLPVGCRRGGCGICRARVLKGNYRSEAMSQEHVSREDRDLGIVLCCSIFALSDITLRLEPAPKARPRTVVAADS
ncbi:2Fe-2S iron-sulfur cluster-binding protein [Paraburkholderia elongata]|uniref:2Fe-2S iron-sulfur cluster binding domain-containing protein n=1 Tax=Paraburkholderia elongata TaxID=2675747 RepID=A0A972SMG8_9BURK|nr:2Fe-2S iron-sulfur cluster binding domain-containing protein [Paraburkholderia elongata]